MARRLAWRGHLRLSLVAGPVSLFPATRTAHDVSFHLSNAKTGNRIRQQVMAPERGEGERRDFVRGYECERDRYVLLTEKELRSVRLESTPTREIERFVDAADIDRIWWNDPYDLALEQAGKVAIGRIVLSTRDTSTLSAATYAITLPGFVLSFTYGLLMGAWAIFVTNGVCGALPAFILLMKLLPPAGEAAIADALEAARNKPEG